MSESDSKYELCVICDAATKEREDQHIDSRNYYVEGCGQLCEKCYIEIYSNIHWFLGPLAQLVRASDS